MRRIVIKRIERTIYSTVVELPDEEATKLLLESPEKNTARLASLCPAKSDNWNWMDAEDAEYEVEEDDA